MNIGIVCVSLPAFSKMLRHHLPPFQTLRSKVYSQWAKLRSSQSGESASQSGISRSTLGDSLATSEHHAGPYVHLNDRISPHKSTDPETNYELGQLRSFQTFIGRGGALATSDDKIHLTHEIKQEQEVVHEKPKGLLTRI